jgi:ribose transport system permease protein
LQRRKKSISGLFNNYGIVFVLIGVCIVITILNPKFITGNNLLNVIRQISMTGIVATGMTFVILQADIDLSVGSVAALGGVLSAGFVANSGLPVALAVILALAICSGLGFLMGFIITKANVHSFVVSLGMLSIARGLTMIYTDGYPISNLGDAYCFIGGGNLGGIPMPIIIFAVFLIAAWFVLSKTPFGKYIYSIGGNAEATRLSGIDVNKFRTISFAVSGFCACFAGIILAGRVQSGQPTAAEGWELDAIAAVVIGGTSMSGGRGGIIGTFIGALFMGVLRNGLNLLQVSTFYQSVFIGVLIIVAVVIDSARKDK